MMMIFCDDDASSSSRATVLAEREYAHIEPLCHVEGERTKTNCK